MKMRLSKILVSLILLLLITPVYVMAIPSAEFLYTESDLGGGWWKYDYTLLNIMEV